MAHPKTGKKVRRTRWGFVDTNGELLVPLQFGGVSRFRDGLPRVTINNKWAYINTKGQVIWREE